MSTEFFFSISAIATGRTALGNAAANTSVSLLMSVIGRKYTHASVRSGIRITLARQHAVSLTFLNTALRSDDPSCMPTTIMEIGIVESPIVVKKSMAGEGSLMPLIRSSMPTTVAPMHGFAMAERTFTGDMRFVSPWFICMMAPE